MNKVSLRLERRQNYGFKGFLLPSRISGLGHCCVCQVDVDVLIRHYYCCECKNCHCYGDVMLLEVGLIISSI